MRFVILFVAAWTTASLSFSQSPCTPTKVDPGLDGKPPTATEIVRNVIATTPTERLIDLIPGDVEYVLKCGTQEQAETVFRSLENNQLKMIGATVIETNQDWIRVAWDDGFTPPLGAFVFKFGTPLTILPTLGQKVIVTGTYLSFTREPFLITLRKSAVAPMPPPAVVRPIPPNAGSTSPPQ